MYLPRWERGLLFASGIESIDFKLTQGLKRDLQVVLNYFTVWRCWCAGEPDIQASCRLQTWYRHREVYHSGVKLNTLWVCMKGI